MERVPVSSSSLASVGYDPDSQILEIEFRNGAVYQYPDFSLEDFTGFMNADSKGQFFNAYVKHRPYNKM